MSSNEQRIALITGGNRGLGESIGARRWSLARAPLTHHMP